MNKNRKFAFILISLLIIVTPAFSADLRATVDEINGKVDFKVPGGDWQPLSTGDVLGPGDSISTGFNAKAVLILGDTSVLVANALTRLTLSELAEKEGTVTTDLFLDVGNVRAEVHSSDEVSNDFQIRNSNSTASVRGTVLDVEILGDGRGMRVMAWDGMAEVRDLRTGRKAKVGEAKKDAEEDADEEEEEEEEESEDEDSGDDESSGDEGSGDEGSADDQALAADDEGTGGSETADAAGSDSGDAGSQGGAASDAGSSAPSFSAPPEPPAQIAAAPLMASGSGGGMVSSMASAIAATTVTVSTKPPAPTSISTGGGSSATTETTASVTTTTEEIIQTTVVPTTSNVNITVTWPWSD